MPFSEWKKLLFGIERGACVLFLGPELAVDAPDGSREIPAQSLARQLLRALDDARLARMDPRPNDLPWIARRYLTKEGQVGLEMELTNWYEQWRVRPSTLHADLASLPFRLIITTGLDPLMESALRAAHKEPAVERYHYRGDNKELLPVPTPHAPVLFHLYGQVSEPESVVLSELQILDFLARLIGREAPLPKDLSAALTQGKLFLFLGFGLQEWYLRILFHVLRVLRSDSSGFAIDALDVDRATAPQPVGPAPAGPDADSPRAGVEVVPAPGDALPDPTILFYRENFKIDYSRMDTAQFVRELRQRFEESGGRERVATEAAAQKDWSGAAVAAMPRAPAPKVFICHASEDKTKAAEIHEALKRAQLEPWLDRNALRGGDHWERLIQSTIDEVDYVVVVNSGALEEKSQGSSFVNREINHALDRAKSRLRGSFIVPAIIDETPLLKELSAYQAVDLRQSDGLTQLVRALKRQASA